MLLCTKVRKSTVAVNMDDDEKEKVRSYGSIILLVVCVSLELISAACAIAFGSMYDETASDFPGSSAGLIIAGIFGQLACGGCAICVVKPSQCIESRAEGCGGILALVVLALAVLCLGVLQLIATILMAVVTANNPAPNVQAFGGFITALNGIITILSMTYCCFIHGPLLSKMDIKTREVD